MKRIILLIETENSKFLIKKQKSGYCLPILTNIESVEDKVLSNEILNKYDLKVNCFISKAVSSQDTLIKCRLRGDYNQKKYREGIMNNIVSLLTPLYQKKIIKSLIMDIHKEILNDVIWLGILLSAKIEIKNKILKMIVTSFVLYYSSIFCDEILNYDFGVIKEETYFSKKIIKGLRNYYLKDIPSSKSKKAQEIIKEMGINFEEYTFDIVLYTYNNVIIDFNSRLWKENDKTNEELYSGIVLTPRNWIKNIFPQLNESFEEVRKPFVEIIANKLNKIKIKSKIYSIYKLFEKDLDKDSKIYILQRLGLLKTTMLISNLFFKTINIKPSDGVEISFDKFLRKAKASLIVMLGNEKEKIPILKEILDNNPHKFDDSFFVLNRKYRNNLHYGFYNQTNLEEIEILDRNQDVYLNYVIKNIEKCMKIKLGLWHYLLLSLSYLQYWANDKK